MSFVYIDIDHFKEINDKHGHVKGDEVLKFVGHVLKKYLREIDVPCRYGGDEFCLILPECNSKNAKILCKRIIHAFSERYPDFSLSVGIAETGNESYIDGDALIHNADEKMCLAKKDEGSQIR
ncbi:GGDEF domain-containing protein [Solemya elarraichensis gill symbiont]|uniref:GGDEF domain-containing protein n=1 Tax=Solemya elarraichensis gill symbiont TaxID=1918949 RepID=UPI001FEC6AE8|nr:GGDEF domain-containing protein [Solemya elarraichensis gill symbiont]